MKRWISSLMLIGISGAVLAAQGPFTIVRPADGSKVREKVRILIPKDSVPAGAYVGVFLDGKLIEATVPPIEGKYRVYTLDTKGRDMADTEVGKTQKLELVLYTDYEDKARVVDRSSIDIAISNQANIPVPNSGLKLRYSFKPGTQMVYNLAQSVQVSSISEQQQKLGGKAALADMDLEHLRLLYSVDNAYGDGDGLLRMQALPTKGKDYADLTPSGATEPTRFYTADMAPLYMRISNTGHEVFGALPPSVPLFSTSAGSADPTHLYANWPLPTLPTKAIRPGDAWQSRFQSGSLDLDKYPNISSVVTQVPARGQFVGVEWEQGHPCAKILNTIEEGSLDPKTKEAAAAAGGQMGGAISDRKISLNETIWFSLDTHKVLKIVRDETIDVKTNVSSGGFPGMSGGPSMGGPAGMRGGPGNKMGDKGIMGSLSNFVQKGGGPPTGVRAGASAAGDPNSNRGSMGGPGGPGGGPSVPSFVRVRILQIFTLEQ
ncbi:hypothetical protein BH11ARM1_BH11ARM1_00430 [soil metagenome]